jgi:hypothetical protein
MKPTKQEMNQATVYWILIVMTIAGFALGIDWMGFIGIVGLIGFSALMNSMD